MTIFDAGRTPAPQPEERTGEMERQPSTEDRETRRHILQAAEELFIAKGYKGVAMKDVAEAVQVTTAALYYYFPEGKEELFAGAIQQMLQEALERVFRLPEAPADFRQRLTQITENLLLAVPVDRLSMLMRDAHEYLRHTKQDLWRSIGTRFSQRMLEVFQQAIDAGEVSREIPAEVLVRLHQGMCAALLNPRRAPPEPPEPLSAHQLAQMVVSVLLDGIRNQTPSQT
jgi:AcrR family transcriptional regulator